MPVNASYPDRGSLARQGQEALEIINAGKYSLPDGGVVSIKPALEHAVQGTRVYPPETPFSGRQPGPNDTQVTVSNETTLSAARRLVDEGLKPVALNFASATHPGGGFLFGARAQEEYLARSTGLYACLKGQPMYDYHQERSDPLYSSYLIYSPGVPVFRDEDGSLLEQPWQVSLITAAAPNASSLPAERQAEIEAAFEERIAKILWTGLQHGQDAIVLGAWGCGVFGNDPGMVSRKFRKAVLDDFAGAYRSVVFAVLDTSPDRRTIWRFEEAFED